MPVYEYKCESCDGVFEELVGIDQRDSISLCDLCGASGCVSRCVSQVMVASDTTMTPNKATGGQWNALIDKITQTGVGIDKTAKANLENTKSLTGRRWRG